MKTKIWLCMISALVLSIAIPAIAQIGETEERNVRPSYQSQIVAERSPSGLMGIYNQHSDTTNAINSQNVANMQLAWQIDTDDYVSHSPLTDGDRVYFADWGGNVYGADASTGEIAWKNKIAEPMQQWPWHGFAGTGTLAENVLVEASVEGTAFGVDLDTGEVLWETEFTDDPEAGSISALLHHDGLVYIGVSSVEEPLSKMLENFEVNARGKVVALDANTGEIAWERYLVEPSQNGVTVWSSFALDPEMNALFFTTGNNYTGEATELSDSLVAVDAQTGEIIWATQTLEHDVWLPVAPKGPDYDFGAGAQLFEASIDGEMRKLVGAGQKSGFYWAFDRMTGEPLWFSSIGYGSKGGGIHAEAAVGDGTIYVWSNNRYLYPLKPEEHPINVKAIDTATGEYLWVKPDVQAAGVTSAGFLANDVYFVGTLDGQVYAYRASDGEQLWTSQKHPGISASLNVVSDRLYFSAGIPQPFGAGKEHGVFAYTINSN